MYTSASYYSVLSVLSHTSFPLSQHGGYSRTVVFRLLENKYTSVVSSLPDDQHLPLFVVIQQEPWCLLLKASTPMVTPYSSVRLQSHVQGCTNVTLAFKYCFFFSKHLFPTLAHFIRITEESTLTL